MGLWRYRVGDYRIICQINDNQLLVLVVRIAHRSRAYD
ncbi:MAG: type II toxin-antitoxin system RelE family toxin [Synechococcus lacustris]